MGEPKSDEGSPPGCTVEVKVKKDGKKDKVKVEKVAAKGLPRGWIKEVKTTKKSGKVRRDAFYIDPVSGYVFRSMKDAHRFVETGVVGKHAFRPNDNDKNDKDLHDDKICSPTEAKKQKVVVHGTEGQFIGQVSNVSGITKDQQMNKEEKISLSDHASAQNKVGKDDEFSSSNLSVAKGSDHNVPASAIVVDTSNKQSQKDEKTSNETQKTQLSRVKSKVKKTFDLPRRASKRLAGIALDPTPELKTNTRASRTAVREPPEVVRGVAEGSLGGIAHKDANKSNCSSRNSATRDENSGMVEIESKGDSSQVVLLQKNQAILDVHSGKVESDDQVNQMPGPPLDLPLADLWADPCIAFAIKTLTGISDDTAKVSSESNSSKYPSWSLATSEDHSGREETGNILPLPDPAIPRELAGKPEKRYNKTDEKPGSPLDMPCADIFADPCIEFAIKTLTGAISIGCEQNNQDYFQPQSSSLQTQSSSHLTFSDVSTGNFSQTGFLSQQFNVTEGHVSTEQAILEPVFSYTRTASLQSSGGTVLQHRGKERR
ncbi:hypothetical protein SLEP1_g17045 [Rubroshorea leprosula]|uniref:MBD domain-containing protein n=3 Tax=Rubroshorea leprosula TaxID=152421 RepID=A0AAV5J0I2_9ROSI|nr:hypothetical protein SLEP1_g17045 [Rubroshorea leprosula]